jgi:glycosyltransferase involved in cell wall biosynthesis
LTGVISDDDLAAILAGSHAVVIPSDYSGCGAAYLEGMGFGLPAIGTTSGAARESIVDGVNGYLVPPNDPVTLANRLQSLAANRAKLTQMSLAARGQLLARPGWNDSMVRLRQTLLSWIDRE